MPPGTAGCGVSGGGSPWGHHEQERRQLPLYREACWRYALPPRMCTTHRRVAHATVSRVTAPAGHTQATDETTNDACPGALREAEQVLIRKVTFVAQCRQEAGWREDFP